MYLRALFVLSGQLLVAGADVVMPTKALSSNQLYLGSSPRLSQTEGCDFGIGFDLTASYGTAAISFSNGTVTTLATVQAEDGYNQMLKRLSLDSSRHPSPPYLTFGDAWDDQGRQFVRMLRKKIGLPASADVGYLASMIKSLRRAAEERLQIPIFKAGITSPHLVALYTEDLRDACEYMGFTYLSFPTRYQLLYETTAIYAGYGYGLCDDFTRKENCKKEQKDMDFDTVVSILFTPTALTVAFSAMKSAYYLSEYDNRRLADFELGYNSRLRQYNENRYWMLVEEQLTAIINIEPYSDPPSKVLLVGEHIDHPSFRNALTKALGDRMNSSLILDSDAKFIAAKGAAELARRLPWDPYES